MSQIDPASAPAVLDAVQNRYAEGAADRVPDLCCPVDYDASLLEVLPKEIIERDYGCGDPSRFVRKGDRVLDLGSGAGKICYMASQLAGPEGSVIGVDATPAMLSLAREHEPAIAERIGWSNVSFRRGHIQDLSLDLERVSAFLEANPVTNIESLEALQAEEARLREEAPLIPDGSVDLVLSNCVLNLVAPGDKDRLFREIERVLAPGGRCAISDIVCDEDVPLELQQDPELWSGCISGALREDRFLQAFRDAGLVGVRIDAYQTEPWAVVRGLEFRSMTIVATKPAPGGERDHREAVIYKGPFAEVTDDAGQTFRRGQRRAVSRRTFELFEKEPFAEHFVPVPPLQPVDASAAEAFDRGCCTTRQPAETKTLAAGTEPRADVAPGTGASSGCC